MQEQLTISRFAFLAGLPPKTLRYYDEIGLLKPAWVDDLTGYRYYTVSQISLAGKIRKWRQIDLPLEDIRSLLDHPECIQEVLTRHAEKLQQEIERHQKSLWLLQHDLQEDTMHYRTERLPTLQTLSIRTHLEPPHYEVIPQAFQELMGHIKQQGYRPSHPSFFVCHNQHESGNNLLEMCIPVEGEVQGSGRIEVRTFESRPAFIGRFVGPYDRTGAAYTTVVEEALRRGLRITGATAEIYVKSVPHTPNPEEYETDIAFFLEE
ncbi:MerR family transcriptional regulator [Deinococcus cellulosilyticus]|uniref:MerR family transcriptional regulator n=1 Tax=Deinococcus cellulosilyticus (strain DSM 18568 / NBRC 106333 / KACC 11606 / 5516J-15) TaxID=1223518 RepID=A0A511MY40_DEIC1|nr:MerR family transcriptional regulator [Deinococcus cellulosilyticus]GEM45473.1 MerR family transcriptional regulator [Deinococcus cellulosilyticus NBRC 106333 = KACC 11606]